MVRPTYAEIDLDAIRHNVEAIGEVVRPAELCAVVKADGYGHGDVPVAEAALEAGATWIAVAIVEEGVRLREAGIDSPILVLSEPGDGDPSGIVRWGLTPTAYSHAFVDALAEAGDSQPVHIKIDTGMHRVGAAPRMIHDLLEAVGRARLEIGALWTHFPVADEDSAFTKAQIGVFDEATASFEVPMVHMANTAGALLFPEARRSMVRVGLGMYGLHPCMDTREVVDLKPAMRLISRVTHVQRLEAGAKPSYGRIKPLAQESTVVTVPVGYADGYARGLSRYGCTIIGGRRYPLAGMVTMDQIVVNVGDAEVNPGDEVVLLGRQGEQEIKADEWAEELETISYEIVCGIGPRVPRRYIG